MGNTCTAFASNTMLIARQARNPAPHNQYSVPDNPFIFPRQKAKPDSKSPATINIIQLVILATDFNYA